MQTISFLLFRLQPPEPAVRMAGIRRSSAGYTADIMMISINVIIFCNYMFCEVYKSHPWRHGYPPYIRRISAIRTAGSGGWSLNRRNKIVCIAHLLLYKIMIYPFLSLPFWPGSGQGKNKRIRSPGWYWQHRLARIGKLRYHNLVS